jgi:hypothetical protein
MTDETALTMTRRQIIDEAKDLVLSRGAYTVREFGTELFWNANIRARDLDDRRVGDWGATVVGRTEADAEAVVTEAVKQAERVLRFLGR